MIKSHKKKVIAVEVVVLKGLWDIVNIQKATKDWDVKSLYIN